MKPAQRLVLWAALLAAIASILYPPWVRSASATIFVGYAWLFSPPKYGVLAVPHLLGQTVIFAAIFGLAYVLVARVEVPQIPAGAIQLAAAISAKLLASVVVIFITAPVGRLVHELGGGLIANIVVGVLFIGSLYLIWRQRPAKSAPPEPGRPCGAAKEPRMPGKE